MSKQPSDDTSKRTDFGIGPFFLLFLLQIAAFQILYILKRWLWPGPIVFYEGLLLGICFFVLGLLGAIVVRKLNGRLASYWIPAAVAAFLFNYAFIITIPSLLERSISITLIGAVAQGGAKGVAFDTINRTFLESYLAGDRQIHKRLTEQVTSDDMVDHDGSYSLTPKGRFIFETNVMLARLYHIDPSCVLAQRMPD
jgi:hypothetical protein